MGRLKVSIFGLHVEVCQDGETPPFIENLEEDVFSVLRFCGFSFVCVEVLLTVRFSRPAG